MGRADGRRWSKATGDGLRLDVTGVAHLFGGEARAGARCSTPVCAHGPDGTRLAIAPTAAAAWALAQFSPSPDLCRVRGEGLSRPARATATPRPCASMRRPFGRSNGWASRQLARSLDVPRARRSPGGFAGPSDVVDALDRFVRPQGGAADCLARRPAAASRRCGWKSRRRIPRRQATRARRGSFRRWSASLNSGGSALGGCRSLAIASTAASPWRRSRRRSEPRAEASQPPARG